MKHDQKDLAVLDKTTLSADEAHAMIGGEQAISRAAFYAAIKRNEVPHLRLGKRILIPRSAFVRWIDSAATCIGQKSSGTAL